MNEPDPGPVPRSGRPLGPPRVPPAVPGEPELPPELDPRGRGNRSSRPGGSRQVLPGAGRTPWAGRVGRALSVVAAVVSVAVLATSGVGYALYAKYDGQIARLSDPIRPEGINAPPDAPRGARNVLLVGSDTRASTGEEFQGKGSEAVTGRRADTIILAHLYGDDDAAQLVSFPRDSYVLIPAYKDQQTGKVVPEHMDKINSAMSEGGIPVLVATLEKLTDIRIDNQITIDFAGFQSMVDAVGGVAVCLLKAAKDKETGIDLAAGEHTLRGEQALQFVRQRKGSLDGLDTNRIKRQQAFIGSLVNKVLSAGTLTSPGKLKSFLDAAISSVTVDQGLTGTDLLGLARQFKGVASGGVAFTTIPYTDLAARRDTSAGKNKLVALLDDAKGQELFTQLREDRAPAQLAEAPPAASAPPAAPLAVQPGSIKVDVLNAAGTPGLGARVADDLVSRGFLVPAAPGNRGTGATGTVVRHGPDKADSARTLAAAVPGATTELDPQLGSTLELVVGSGYDGTVAVTVGPPSASPNPGETAPLTTAASDGCVN